jgi:hypothetical protein
MVPTLYRGPLIRPTARKTVGPRNCPCGTLAQPGSTTPTASEASPSVVPEAPVSQSSQASPSGTVSPSDLRSLLGNQVIRRLAHLATPSRPGHAPRAWGLTAQP